MKITGKGIITILVFFIAFPFLIDLIVNVWVPKNNDVRLTGFLFMAYIRYLPFYLIYLAIAVFVMYLFKRNGREGNRNKSQNPNNVKN